MLDEKDISVETNWFYEKFAHKAVDALIKTGLEAEYVLNRKDALAKVLELITPGATIGCGDSVTLHQIGFFDWLRKQKEHEVFNPFFVERSDFNGDWDKFAAERFRIGRKALVADIFCSGTNAITLDGKLVNIDGNGNRVGPMVYGPGRVIIVAGYNKVVKDVDEAIKRIKEWAAPVNNKRHVYKHGFDFIEKLPCFVTGKCNDCHSQDKGCHITTIIDGWNTKSRGPTNYPHFIILVGESLGI